MSLYMPITLEDGWFISEDKDFVFTILSVSGGIQTISGWTIKFSLSATDGGTNVHSGFPRTAEITSAAFGICTVTILRSDTAALPAATYYYTLWRADFGAYALLAHGTAELQDSETVVPS